jgi:hypothetical protein
MESLAQNPTFGTELNFIFQNKSNNVFDNFYNKPFIGGGFCFENLGNPAILGRSYSVYAFMEIIALKSQNLNFNVRLNGGLAYLTKKHDPLSNPKNIAIGSNISFHFNFNLVMYYHIPDTKFDFRFSGGLIHNSNGSIKKPNLGLNQIFFAAGLAYEFRDVHQNTKQNEKYAEVETPHEFNVMGTFIKNDDYTTNDVGREGNFYCSTLASGYSYRYSLLGKAGVSLDLFYNQNFYYYYDAENGKLIRQYNSMKDIIRTGISFGHELIYKDISLLTYIGAYTYKKVKPDDYFYFRVGVRYYPIKNMFVNLTLKCFGFKAHYIESGIGFSFYKKK